MDDLAESQLRCRALEERVAELERLLADQQPMPALSLQALRITDETWGEGWQLRPSPPRRAWMDEKTHAYQCLPMVVANQWGWQVLCPTDLAVFWDGQFDKRGLTIEIDPIYAPAIKSQFGVGIVTFTPPWLFRTSPGWDLYAKGPSNRWKPNCIALEGVIETWWLNYTFTLNWKLVEPGTVTFRKGESLGQLMPVPHGTFKGARAIEEPLANHPETAAEVYKWREERRRIANDPVVTHKKYLKAQGIPEHLSKVPVPAVQRAPDKT